MPLDRMESSVQLGTAFLLQHLRPLEASGTVGMRVGVSHTPLIDRPLHAGTAQQEAPEPSPSKKPAKPRGQQSCAELHVVLGGDKTHVPPQ